MIVLEDADVRQAAYWSVWGANFNAGQTCMAVERAYVVESVYEEFVRYAVEFTKQLKMGSTCDLASKNTLGPLTDPNQLRVIQDHMQDARAKGAQVLVGGTNNAMYYEPTVLVNVNHSMDVMRDETFGPILPIVQVKDEHEAIALTNDSPFGLGASVWSNNIPRAERVAHQLQAASVLINDALAQFAIPMVPFGGVKASGFGRVHGKEGLTQVTHPFSYVVGKPPHRFDLTVVLRSPGNYRLMQKILHLAFGTTLSQKLRGLCK